MLNKIFIIIFCIFHSILIAQSDSLSFKNGIDKPSIISTHHFGIFTSRINTNFKLAASKHITFNFSSISGNNFHPYVEAYFPKDSEVRKEQSQYIWYNRSFYFINQATTPADYMNIVIDAVIKEYRIAINIPLATKHELGITLRSNLITKGKYPFSFFTSDETIEWFHSNIAGGEDPYGRRYYGLNQVNFKYNDRNGHTLQLNNNDFFISGIELNHHYYPNLTINKSHNTYINFGSHLGLNTSKFNPSLDFGVSVNTVKKIELNNNYDLNFGFGANVLRKNIINFNEVIDLGNNKYLATIEGEIELTKYTKKRNYHAFGLNYQAQTRYNKKREADYFKLIGKWQEINGGWQHGVYTLYEPQINWNFIYTYARPNFALSIYFKEDFRINNAPDLQTGIGLKIPVFKK